MLQTGWKQDGHYPNRLVKGTNDLRCALHKRGYKIERFNESSGKWVFLQSENYSKVK